MIAERGFDTIILGGPGEEALGQRVAAAIVPGAFNCCGVTTLLQSAALLKRCRFLVTNDTGTMHLAAAVNTRCVAIFSCHNFRGEWDPYGASHLVLRAEVPCGPCFLAECPRDNLCVRKITTDAVAGAVLKCIEEIEGCFSF